MNIRQLMGFFIKRSCTVNSDVASAGRVQEFDGYRGVAVLTIVFFHYIVNHLQSQPGSLLAYSQKYLILLRYGVDAFFVLSGFLIGGILIDQRNAPNLFRVFYLRRSLRIFPTYFLLLACWWLASALRTVPGMQWLLEPDFPHWPYVCYAQNILMAVNNAFGPNFVAATWTLAIEEQFYLLFPLLVRFAPRQLLPKIFIFGALSAPAIRWAVDMLGPAWNQAQICLLPTRWDSLLLGAWVAALARLPATRSLILKHRPALVLCLGFLGFFMTLSPFISNSTRTPLRLFAVIVMPLMIAGTFGLLLLLLHFRCLPQVASALSGRLLRYFGQLSYTVYLFHTAILGLSFSLLLGREPILSNLADWAVTVFAFALTVGLAHLSWLFLERRLIRFGHHSNYGANATAPLAAVAA